MRTTIGTAVSKLHLADQRLTRYQSLWPDEQKSSSTPMRVGSIKLLALLVTSVAIGLSVAPASAAKEPTKQQLSKQLKQAIEWHSDGEGIRAFRLPYSHQYRKIPQDPNNKLTAAKVKLGKLLFHETALGRNPQDASLVETYSCASCHHAAAGFKSGVRQGLGEGGTGFSSNGKGRKLAQSHKPGNENGFVADFQPIASPTVLNAAYQDVMLWNGSFGNSAVSVNKTVDADKVSMAGPPNVLSNDFGLSGLEIQAIAGTKVHRLKIAESVLETEPRYQRLFRQAFPRGVDGIPEGSEVDEAWLGSALAIAAYERTVLANKAPFQKWLRGNVNAMSRDELRGGLLFFGKAGCVGCHTGPALSSKPGATEDRMFFNVGFDNLDTSHNRVHGTIDLATRRGRGGFTGRSEDRFKFKIPQLYNLKDSSFFGHGASFRSVRQVIKYKNKARPQSAKVKNLAPEFTRLHLTDNEIDDLTAFVEEGLYDKNLSRYVPKKLPSGACFPVADMQSVWDLNCF